MTKRIIKINSIVIKNVELEFASKIGYTQCDVYLLELSIILRPHIKILDFLSRPVFQLFTLSALKSVWTPAVDPSYSRSPNTAVTVRIIVGQCCWGLVLYIRAK